MKKFISIIAFICLVLLGGSNFVDVAAEKVEQFYKSSTVDYGYYRQLEKHIERKEVHYVHVVK